MLSLNMSLKHDKFISYSIFLKDAIAKGPRCCLVLNYKGKAQCWKWGKWRLLFAGKCSLLFFTSCDLAFGLTGNTNLLLSSIPTPTPTFFLTMIESLCPAVSLQSTAEPNCVFTVSLSGICPFSQDLHQMTWCAIKHPLRYWPYPSSFLALRSIVSLMGNYPTPRYSIVLDDGNHKCIPCYYYIQVSE